MFLLSFCVNLAWELLHTPLYSGLPDSTDAKLLICTVAALADALYVMAAYLMTRHLRRQQTALLMAAGILTAVCVEAAALRWNFWHYSGLMPVVPMLHVGLSPALQLALTSVAVVSVSEERVLAPAARDQAQKRSFHRA